ncbi:hypothetical protein FMUBM48_34050 [Nocardia cyriacigeorgica]|nr:hypothetical protein FMUBM48_34050 [Nocardia cyriacigeorgica]
MGGIDDSLDLPRAQELPQTLRPTEPAHPHLTGGQDRFTNTSGERGDDVESSLAGSDAGQFPGLPGSAQNQDVQGWPLK